MIMVSIKKTAKSENHAHAHSLLRECLKPLDIAYSENTAVSFGEHGKPFLTEFPEIRYNLSHSDGIAACIVSDRECGIDCEKVREFRPGVMKRTFSDPEQELVMSAPESERDLMFFRLWTLKEAYIKGIGVGLSFPMKKAEFFFEGKRVVSNIPDWKFRQYVLKKGEYVVSICEQNVNNFADY